MVENSQLYWTMVAAVLSAGWVLITSLRDRALRSAEATSAIVTRLLEGDQIKIEHPDIQQYLSQKAGCDIDDFRSPAILGDPLFYKAKSFVYRQMNMFDEILSYSSKASSSPLVPKPPALLEIDDWKEYMVSILRHPLHRSVIMSEGHIFGESLRGFWLEHREYIESKPADPFAW